MGAAQTGGHQPQIRVGPRGRACGPSSQGCGERTPSCLGKPDRQLEGRGTGSLCTSFDPTVEHQGFTEVGPTCPPLLDMSISGQGISQRRLRGTAGPGAPIFHNMVNAGHLHFCLPPLGASVFGSQKSSPLPSEHLWGQDPTVNRAQARGRCSAQPGSPLKGNLFRRFVFSAAFFLNLFAF